MSEREPKSVLSLNEAQARYLLVGPGLKATGWNLVHQAPKVKSRIEALAPGVRALVWRDFLKEL